MNFLECNIVNKLDISNYSFAHLALILLLHYNVKCPSHSLAIYDNKFIVGSTDLGFLYAFHSQQKSPE